LNYYLALDVGGTAIKSGILGEEGSVLHNRINTHPSKAQESKEIIIKNIIEIIKMEILKIKDPDLCINGIGLAFPGPFDYEMGVSFITGIGKYENLYGINVKAEMLKLINNDVFFNNILSEKFTIRFENDASLYALGESYSGEGKNYNKALYICLGTGIGSAFLQEGKLIKYREDIPENGWIYKEAFKEGIVDDYVSARGILKNAVWKIGKGFEGTVKDLYYMAKDGDELAIECFNDLGNMLGQVLITYIKTFQPEVVVIGGEISKSYEYFKNGFLAVLQEEAPLIKISRNSSISTLIGVYGLFKNNEEEKVCRN
jgi:glucokinase